MNYNQENKGLEDFIKNSFEDYEIEYNPEHWSELEQKLKNVPNPQNKNWFRSLGFKLTAITVLVISGLAYYNFIYKATSFITDESTAIRQLSSKSNEKGSKPAKDIILSQSEDEKKPEQTKTESLQNVESKTSVIKAISNLETIGKTNEKTGNKNGSGGEKEISSNDAEVIESAIPVINTDYRIIRASECDLSTQFIVKNPDKDIYDYEWYFGDGNSSKSTSYLHTFSSPGKYEVTLMVSSKDQQKQILSKKEFILEKTATPSASFEWKAFNSGSLKYGAEFTDKTSDATEWHWSFGDNRFSYERNPRHLYLSKGRYQVELIVKNNVGCTDTVAQMIEIEEDNTLLAPSGFSPDGDGLNDTFIPKALEVTNYPFELLIYDRNGSLVYKTTDSNKPWNGRNMKSGDVYSTGTTFFWIVNLNKEGIEETFFGNVILLK